MLRNRKFQLSVGAAWVVGWIIFAITADTHSQWMIRHTNHPGKVVPMRGVDAVTLVAIPLGLYADFFYFSSLDERK